MLHRSRRWQTHPRGLQRTNRLHKKFTIGISAIITTARGTGSVAMAGAAIMCPTVSWIGTATSFAQETMATAAVVPAGLHAPVVLAAAAPVVPIAGASTASAVSTGTAHGKEAADGRAGAGHIQLQLCRSELSDPNYLAGSVTDGCTLCLVSASWPELTYATGYLPPT